MESHNKINDQTERIDMLTFKIVSHGWSINKKKENLTNTLKTKSDYFFISKKLIKKNSLALFKREGLNDFSLLLKQMIWQFLQNHSKLLPLRYSFWQILRDRVSHISRQIKKPPKRPLSLFYLK